MYHYRARCIRVIDGDTAELDIDLGFNLTARHRVRVLGIDTPEMNDADPVVRSRARLAKETLTGLLSTPAEHGPWPLVIKTEKADSFGRYLATISAGGIDVATHMLSLGLAAPYRP